MSIEITQDDYERLSVGFGTLRQIRHNVGEQKYGPMTFQHNDIFRMIAEELADAANYLEYQFVKLMKLQEELQERYPETKDQDFNGTKVGWNE